MKAQDHFDTIIERFKLKNPTIYPYGSQVYGTQQHNSDYDYIVVDDNARDGCEEICYCGSDELNVHFHSPSHWIEMIKEHKIFAMESIFQETKDLYRKHFNLDLSKLRKEISEKSSNSWVKCKKKLTVEHDYRIGLKSLFHSFRIIDFGIQIARDGCINEYYSCRMRSLFNEINQIYPCLNRDTAQEEWERINTKYKSLHNQMMTEFRSLAPK